MVESVWLRIEFLRPQFNLEGDTSGGRLLIAAVDGTVVGKSCNRISVDERMRYSRQEYNFDLSDMQAFVAPTDVDISAGLLP